MTASRSRGRMRSAKDRRPGASRWPSEQRVAEIVQAAKSEPGGGSGVVVTGNDQRRACPGLDKRTYNSEDVALKTAMHRPCRDDRAPGPRTRSDAVVVRSCRDRAERPDPDLPTRRTLHRRVRSTSPPADDAEGGMIDAFVTDPARHTGRSATVVLEPVCFGVAAIRRSDGRVQLADYSVTAWYADSSLGRQTYSSDCLLSRMAGIRDYVGRSFNPVTPCQTDQCMGSRCHAVDEIDLDPARMMLVAGSGFPADGAWEFLCRAGSGGEWVAV